MNGIEKEASNLRLALLIVAGLMAIIVLVIMGYAMMIFIP